MFVWIHKDACEYGYENSEIDLFFMSKLGFWFPLGMWILVWIHKEACEYTYGNSQNDFVFMIKLGFWFPLGM